MPFGKFLANPWLIDLGDTIFKDCFFKSSDVILCHNQIKK